MTTIIDKCDLFDGGEEDEKMKETERDKKKKIKKQKQKQRCVDSQVKSILIVSSDVVGGAAKL